MKKRFLLVDFINPGGTFAMTTDVEKVNHNVALIPELKENIETKKKQPALKAMTVMAVFGRWILVYQGNVLDSEETMLYIVDFRLDVTGYSGAVFSENAIRNIVNLQERYDVVFKPAMDIIELTFAETFEEVLQPNLFACGLDEIVLKKAAVLGSLPALKVAEDSKRTRVVLCDERELKDEKELMHIYAFIKFAANNEEPEGFGYIKVYDARSNQHLFDPFLKAILDLGVEFDRAFLVERFSKAKMN